MYLDWPIQSSHDKRNKNKTKEKERTRNYLIINILISRCCGGNDCRIATVITWKSIGKWGGHQFATIDWQYEWVGSIHNVEKWTKAGRPSKSFKVPIWHGAIKKFEQADFDSLRNWTKVRKFFLDNVSCVCDSSWTQVSMMPSAIVKHTDDCCLSDIPCSYNIKPNAMRYGWNNQTQSQTQRTKATRLAIIHHHHG